MWGHWEGGGREVLIELLRSWQLPQKKREELFHWRSWIEGGRGGGALLAWPNTAASLQITMEIHISNCTHKFQNQTGLDAKAYSELYKSNRVNSAIQYKHIILMVMSFAHICINFANICAFVYICANSCTLTHWHICWCVHCSSIYHAHFLRPLQRSWRSVPLEEESANCFGLASPDNGLFSLWSCWMCCFFHVLLLSEELSTPGLLLWRTVPVPFRPGRTGWILERRKT
jgi:hypothetical protein